MEKLRGGFRMTCYYLMNEGIITLVSLERRANLGSRRERVKDQKRYTDFIRQLKEELLDVYVNNS